jgi:hypothetical protein
MKGLFRFIIYVLILGGIGFGLYFFFVIKAKPEIAGTYDGDCPPEGSARELRLQELNRLKNRADFPNGNDFDGAVTMQTLLAPGEDRNRWSSGKAAELIGYAAEVKATGPESCNCKSKDPDHRDTHIELVLEPMVGGSSNSVIVEITPRLRQKMAEKGVDWSTRALRDKVLGRWVKVQGWLMFDEEHVEQANNTNPGGARNWRGTCWEIHPITSIEVINQPL